MKDVAVDLGGKTLLSGITFRVDRGELVGLVGPNGSGKSTLFRMLANLRAPSAGEITYDGKAAADLGARTLSKLVSYLEQDGTSHWPLNTRTLVELGRLPHRRMFHWLSEDDETAVARAMKLTDTTVFASKTVAQLSGGERMRIMLARAICAEAPLLLADEPIAALDPRHQLMVMSLLRRYASQQNAVAVVLHDLSMAARFCQKLILISGGTIIAQGRSDKVLSPRNIREAYRVEVVSGKKNDIPFYLPA
ncbi:MAG: ABC transporter ATP-binding protein [Afipia sp.]|nr:ABC transporter ATP-binding protein [Afipia sp.]